MCGVITHGQRKSGSPWCRQRRKRDDMAKQPEMRQAYLTDGRTWVEYWDERNKMWAPVEDSVQADLLKRIAEHKIPIIWRGYNIAEFYLDRPAGGKQR